MMRVTLSHTALAVRIISRTGPIRPLLRWPVSIARPYSILDILRPIPIPISPISTHHHELVVQSFLIRFCGEGAGLAKVRCEA
jgi:hypothetical protein